MTESFIIGSVLGFNTESAIIAKANRTVYPKEISEIKFTDNPKVKNWFTNYDKRKKVIHLLASFTTNSILS